VISTWNPAQFNPNAILIVVQRIFFEVVDVDSVFENRMFIVEIVPSNGSINDQFSLIFRGVFRHDGGSFR